MSIYGNFEPTPFMFSETISDVNDVLTTLTARLVTTPSALEKWTEGPAGTFTSPVDGFGRFVTLIFTAASATQLNLRVLDQNTATLINTAGNIRSIVIGGPTVFRYFTCSKFAYIQTEPDFQHLGGGMLTAFPESEGGNANYCYAHGTNNNGGVAEGFGAYVTQYFMLDNGSPNLASRLVRKDVSIDGTAFNMQAGTGAFRYEAAEFRANYSGVNRVAGRIFNAYTCDSSLAPGVTRTLPIGNSGETGLFRVLGTNVQPGTVMRIMLRIA